MDVPASHPQSLCEIRHDSPSLLLLQWLGLSYSYPIHPLHSGLTALRTESETMTWLGNKLVISAQNELIAEQAKARSAGNEALSIAEDQAREARNTLMEADNKFYQVNRLLRNEQIEKAQIQVELKKLKQESQQWRDAIAERDAIILEWVLSNEAYRRLAREYGKKLEITEEQIIIDVSEHVLDVAEEDQDFVKTKRYEKAKKRLGK